MNNNSILEKIDAYLNELDGINEYVIAIDGFPVYWSSNVDYSRAEELAAFATDIIINTSRFFDLEKNLIFLIYTMGKYTGIAGFDNVVFITRGEQNIVAKALENVIRVLKNNPLKCGWCKYDLTLNIILCPSSHKLPMGIDVCPICGKRINYINCPKCNRLISSIGNRVFIKRPLSRLIAGLIMGVTSLATVVLGIFISSHNYIISVILFITAGILGGISYKELSSKTYVEEINIK